jgi:hypothetical protein
MLYMMNVKRSSILILVILLGVTFSCDDNGNVKTDEIFQSDENFVSANEAVALLQQVADISKPRTKNGRVNVLKKKLQKVESLRDERSKPVLHVINYEGGGFVIFSADNRAKPVLAYSDTDSFPVDEKLFPPGLIDWLTYTKEYVDAIRKENKPQSFAQVQQVLPCEVGVEMNIVPPDECGPGTCQNEYEEVGPLLTSTWDQGCGYNNNTPLCSSGGSCGRAFTGCVATAMAQVMRYHRFPTFYNWAVMPNAVFGSGNVGSPQISQLMRDIGDNVNMSYGCSGSSADTEDQVAQTFTTDFGYSSASYINYEGTANYDRVESEIRAGRPVILRGGRRSGSWPFYKYVDGHAWVADGFRDSFLWSDDCSMGWGYLSFHMNWGWGGSFDGWYGFNDFTPGSNTFNYKSGAVVNIRP